MGSGSRGALRTCALSQRGTPVIRSGLIAVATALVFLSTASTAAPGGDYSVETVRRIAYQYAKCVVWKQAQAASDALLSDIGNDEITKRYSSLLDGDCLARFTQDDVELSFPGDLYRYALADALVAREFANKPMPDLSNVPPLERRSLPKPPATPSPDAKKSERVRYEKAERAYDQVHSSRVLRDYGECVVRTNPAGARDLLLTEPDSAGETADFGALRPALEHCLQQGTVAFTRLILRGTIALNFYRLAHATDPKHLQ